MPSGGVRTKTTAKHTKPTIWSTAYVNLMAISFFQSMGQMMMNTLVPLYAYDLGATAQMVGVVAGSFAVTALIMRPFAGPAFDAFSKKRILMASLFVIVVATLLYGVAVSVPVLIVARLLHGAGMACTAPVALTIVSESLPPEKMSSGLSVYGLAFVVAQSVGPAFGLWLLGFAGYGAAFHVCTVTMVVSFVLAMNLKESDNPVKKPYRLKVSRMFAKEAAVPASLSALLSLSFSCISAFVVIYGKLCGVMSIGYYFTVYAVCLLATRPVFGMLSDKYGAMRIIPIGLVCFAFSLVLVGCAQDATDFFLAAAVGAFGYGVVLPLLQSVSMLCVSHDVRGSASNTNFLGLDVGNLVGPMLGGAIVGVLHGAGLNEMAAYSGMYLLLVVPIGIAFALFFLNRKKMERSVMAVRGDLESNDAAT